MSDNDISAEVVDPAADEASLVEAGSAPVETISAVEPTNDRDVDADGDDSDSDDESEGPLETEGEVAADYLEELLDIADLDGDIDTFVESGRAHVSILTDSKVLIGRDG